MINIKTIKTIWRILELASQPILGQCSISIPLENLWAIGLEHQPEMG